MSETKPKTEQHTPLPWPKRELASGLSGDVERLKRFKAKQYRKGQGKRTDLV